jgi:predicted nuclease of predicted toxin-antitoxin system
MRLRDHLPTDTPDPIVAKVAQESDAILVSHDGDFKKIAPRIPNGSKARFRSLSRIHLQCENVAAATRLAAAISLVEFEWTLAQARPDKRIHITVQANLIKTSR